MNTFTGPEWAELWNQMPSRQPYEADATKAQKNRLWKMGLDDPAFLNELGKDQASWLITAADNAQRKTGNAPRGCLKIIAIAAVVILIAGIYSDRENKRTRANAEKMLAELRTPQSAPAPPTGPSLVFTSVVTQHIPGGLLIRADNFLEALPKGYTLADINGDFFLVGYPGESSTADGARLTFRAAHGELFTFRSVLGANRTIRKIHYTAPYTSRR